LIKYGACTKTGRPARLAASRSAASWAVSPGGRAQLRGLAAKTWMASAPTAAAYRRHVRSDQALSGGSSGHDDQQ